MVGVSTKGLSRETQPEKPFGAKVMSRRLKRVAELEKAGGAGVSKSKLRKTVLVEEKLYRKGEERVAFDTRCCQGYQQLLLVCKSKLVPDDTKADRISELLALIFENPQTSPVRRAYDAWQSALKATTTKNREEQKRVAELLLKYVKELTRPNVSRCLQTCYKLASQLALNSKGAWKFCEMVCHYVEDVFAETACANSAGSHLCVKLLTYGSKEQQESFAARLRESYKSFWSKSGLRVWETLIRRSPNQKKCLREIVQQLFFERCFAACPATATAPDFKTKFLACSELLQKTIRERAVELLDKLVLKELMDSEISQHFLRTILFEVEPLHFGIFGGPDDVERGTKAMETLIEATSEATNVLLRHRDGVESLCKLVCWWTAKQKKAFVKEQQDKLMPLNQLSWGDYVANPVDSVFIVKLLLCTDDTKLMCASVLASLLGVRATTSKGDLAVDEDNFEAAVSRMQTAPELVLGLLAAVMDPANLSRYISKPQDVYVLRQFEARTAKKDGLVRAQEYRDFIERALAVILARQPAVAEVALRPLTKQAVFGAFL